jgi:hypothetical protein
MAGYGLKAFLIAQSLNQIEKAYGPNNAILDNCHVRVSFATNDERTAKRVSDALGTATEMRAMKNYAGHRLSPWLGHLMVSRSETARQLLTPGEVMQLPPDDEIVMVAGVHPIRAKKARYYQDRRLSERIMDAPAPSAGAARPDDWTGRAAAADPAEWRGSSGAGGRRQWRAAPRARAARACRHRAGDTPPPAQEFAIVDDERDDVARQAAVRRRMQGSRGKRRSTPATASSCRSDHARSAQRLFSARLAKQVDELAIRRRISRSAIVEAAVTSFCRRTAPTGWRRRSPAARPPVAAGPAAGAQHRPHHRGAGLFVRFWLTVTPPLPDEDQAAAQVKGRKRYEGSSDARPPLRQRQDLLDEIPEDVWPRSTSPGRTDRRRDSEIAEGRFRPRQLHLPPLLRRQLVVASRFPALLMCPDAGRRFARPLRAVLDRPADPIRSETRGARMLRTALGPSIAAGSTIPP